ncbi:MAG: hypothetical protein WC455_16055 [Dehalococcoidia bacterium]|jgi:hypothetical protein
MGLEALSPEEKQTLYEALKAEMGGGDVCECDEKFQQVASLLEAFDGRIAILEDLINNKLIGGIRSLYEDNMRTTAISDLKGKYGSMFDPYMEPFNEMYPDQDLWAMLHDHLAKMKQEDGYTDEIGDMKIKEIADQLRGKVEKIRGPAVAKVEVAKKGPPAMTAEEEVDPMTAIVDSVKKLKSGRGRSSGIMPGADVE